MKWKKKEKEEKMICFKTILCHVNLPRRIAFHPWMGKVEWSMTSEDPIDVARITQIRCFERDSMSTEPKYPYIVFYQCKTFEMVVRYKSMRDLEDEVCDILWKQDELRSIGFEKRKDI